MIYTYITMTNSIARYLNIMHYFIQFLSIYDFVLSGHGFWSAIYLNVGTSKEIILPFAK